MEEAKAKEEAEAVEETLLIIGMLEEPQLLPPMVLQILLLQTRITLEIRLYNPWCPTPEKEKELTQLQNALLLLQNVMPIVMPIIIPIVIPTIARPTIAMLLKIAMLLQLEHKEDPAKEKGN